MRKPTPSRRNNPSPFLESIVDGLAVGTGFGVAAETLAPVITKGVSKAFRAVKRMGKGVGNPTLAELSERPDVQQVYQDFKEKYYKRYREPLGSTARIKHEGKAHAWAKAQVIRWLRAMGERVEENPWGWDVFSLQRMMKPHTTREYKPVPSGKVVTYKGVRIYPTAGGWRTSLESESLHDSLGDAKRFVTTFMKRKENPTTKPEFDVSDVPAKKVKPGDYVKAIFDDKERMWVNVTSVTDKGIVGILDNVPVSVRMKRGQTVRVPFGHIIDVNRNPGGSGDAAELFESFHGRPSEHETDHYESESYRDTLAEIGELVELEVVTDTDNGMGNTISFDGDGVTLASSPDGNQYFFVGGNQDIDDNFLSALDIPSEVLGKDKFPLGYVHSITYHTDKQHLPGSKAQKNGTNYVHEFGEEGGEKPMLVYDRLNGGMELVGGSYVTEERGIIN